MLQTLIVKEFPLSEILTVEELQTLINIIVQVQVSVAQAPPLIELINKLSRMIDQSKAEPTIED